ncbi:unnamed protein product, partial [Rotaria sp. Silwood1]
QPGRIQTALVIIVALLLLPTISIAKIIVNFRLNDQCSSRPRLVLYVIVQDGNILRMIIVSMLLKNIVNHNTYMRQ